jgi:hypothetical protein
MNESELKQYCLEHAGETLTAEAEALLKRNPELKRQVDQLVMVSKIISLKRYEQPHATCEQRCVNAVTARIEELQDASAWTKLTGWFADEQPAARWVYGMAALLICAVGISFALRENPVGTDMAAVPEVPVIQTDVAPEVVETLAEVTPVVVEPAEEVAIATADFPAFEKPLIVLQVNATNPQPSSRGMSFGPGPSVPVSFEY